ncbi:uncharacterized protein LOC131023647 [Salvia miltiorrhiza]|uniref:uncharacterized protein LOC131023647 n=1 Tax=Salvia miltiorrhiza TaxID=226208 RepID=UPI0025AD695C|nr:uncharacterized protein LOC131023647 [Salvia miltiorrhiza]
MVGGECDTCKAGLENLWHTFYHCPFAEEVWRCSGVQAFITDITAHSESFVESLFLIIGSSDAELKAKICMLLWQIWRDRNGVIWKGAIPAPTRSIAAAMESRNDWIMARHKLSHQVPSAAAASTCVGWHPLQPGYVKCGVDVAFFEDLHAMGVGLVLRDHEGHFIMAKTLKVQGLFKVEEGELMGIKEALSWLKELCYNRGWVESDCKLACKAIRSGERNILELGILAAFCREELSSFLDVQICHVKRDRNVIAHCLARAARDFLTHHVWNEPPALVEGHLHLPCSCV